MSAIRMAIVTALAGVAIIVDFAMVTINLVAVAVFVTVDAGEDVVIVWVGVAL